MSMHAKYLAGRWNDGWMMGESRLVAGEEPMMARKGGL